MSLLAILLVLIGGYILLSLFLMLHATKGMSSTRVRMTLVVLYTAFSVLMSWIVVTALAAPHNLAEIQYVFRWLSNVIGNFH